MQRLKATQLVKAGCNISPYLNPHYRRFSNRERRYFHADGFVLIVGRCKFYDDNTTIRDVRIAVKGEVSFKKYQRDKAR